ncbi:MAG: hypothetical protein PHP10_05070 [Candidatus Omnitrophica bacterium]|nr:hypothetical protein [Candidatus Omnitrophota bacterium]
MSRKIISLVLSICFLFQQTGLVQAAAVELNLSNYFSRMASTMAVESFRPVHLRYFSYDSLNNSFKVLLDKGDQKGTFPKGTPSEVKLKEETKELLKYFLIGVTLPNDKFWVNLRPDSPSSIIDFNLEETDIGKIMLEADLQLKKDTALFTSPQTPEGKEYWDRLYKKASELYGSENITIPTLTRPWIVPNEIIVRETKDSVYIYKATLKVMLEQDYLKDSTTYSFTDSRAKALNEYSSQLIRELIIPKLTKEVNLAKRYALLRQVYYSLILSRWFKSRFAGKKGLSPQGTAPDFISSIDKNDLTNLTSKNTWDKSTYFNAYKKSFAEGEYNIKEPVYTPSGQTIRSYMSGGMDLTGRAASPMVLNSLRVKGKISDFTNILLKNEGWIGFTGRENFPWFEFMSYIKSGDIQYYPPSEDSPRHSYFIKIPGMYKAIVEVYNPTTALNILRRNKGAASPVEKKPSEVKAKLLSELKRLGLSIELIRQYIKMNNKIKPPAIVNAGDHASSTYYFPDPVDFGGQIIKPRVEIRQYAGKKKVVTIFFDRYIIRIVRAKDDESISFLYNYSSDAFSHERLREALTKIDPEKLAKEIMFVLTGLPDPETASISSLVEAGSPLIKAAERVLVTELSGITYKSIDSIEKAPIEIKEDHSGGQVIRKFRLEYMGYGLDIDLHKPLPGQEGPSHAVLYFEEHNCSFEVTIRADDTKIVHISDPTGVGLEELNIKDVAGQMKACLYHGEAVSSFGELSSAVFMKIQISKITGSVNEFLNSNLYFGTNEEFKSYFYAGRKGLRNLVKSLESLKQSKEKIETAIKSGEGIKANIVRDLLRISARAKSAYDAGAERKSELALLVKISDESMRISKEIASISLQKNETAASPLSEKDVFNVTVRNGLKALLTLTLIHVADEVNKGEKELLNEDELGGYIEYLINDLASYDKKSREYIGASERLFRDLWKGEMLKLLQQDPALCVKAVMLFIREEGITELLDNITKLNHGPASADRLLIDPVIKGFDAEKYLKAAWQTEVTDIKEWPGPGRTIMDVERISRPYLIPVGNKDELLKIVEEPLLEAAGILYDKGIEMYSTSANKRDLEFKPLKNDPNSYAHIAIMADQLSEKNKAMLEDLFSGSIKYKDKNIKMAQAAPIVEKGMDYYQLSLAYILIPVTGKTTIEEIREESVFVAKQFASQVSSAVELSPREFYRLIQDVWQRIINSGGIVFGKNSYYYTARVSEILKKAVASLSIKQRVLVYSYFEVYPQEPLKDRYQGQLCIVRMDQERMKRELWEKGIEGLEIASSPVGGIDFKHQAMSSATTYEAMGSFAGLDFSLPKLSSSVLLSFNLDKEQSDISRAIDNGIIVSGQRIKEFMAASSAKGQLEQRRETVLTWLAKLGILEETTCCTQESSPEYREALVIADSA